MNKKAFFTLLLIVIPALGADDLSVAIQKSEVEQVKELIKDREFTEVEKFLYLEIAANTVTLRKDQLVTKTRPTKPMPKIRPYDLMLDYGLLPILFLPIVNFGHTLLKHMDDGVTPKNQREFTFAGALMLAGLIGALPIKAYCSNQYAYYKEYYLEQFYQDAVNIYEILTKIMNQKVPLQKMDN